MKYHHKAHYVNDAAIGDFIHELIDQLYVAGTMLSHEQHAALIAKGVEFLTAEPEDESLHGMEQLVALQPSLIDAIRFQPSVLLDRPINTLNTIVKLHHIRSGYNAAGTLTERTTKDRTPAQITLTNSQGQMTLVELTTPAQMQKESTQVRHHLGAIYNTDALHAKGLAIGDPGAEYFLASIMAMERHVRYFSLRENGQALSTIEYNSTSHSLRVHSGTSNVAKMPYFPALCEALFELSQVVPICTLLGLPEVPEGNVLVKDGTIAPVELAHVRNSVVGKARLTEHTPSELVIELCARRAMTINVECPARLPEIVFAKLVVNTERFDVPTLKVAGDIDAIDASSFIAPSLRQAGNINAPNVTDLEISALQQAGDIDVRQAGRFNAPALENCGVLLANNATEFNIPALRAAADIYNVAAVRFLAPSLKKVRNIITCCKTAFDAPALQNANNIDADCYDKFDAPLLERAGRIKLIRAQEVNLPTLRLIKALDAPQVGKLGLLNLQSAGELNIDQVAILGTPALISAARINAPRTTLFCDTSLQVADLNLGKVLESGDEAWGHAFNDPSRPAPPFGRPRPLWKVLIHVARYGLRPPE